MVNVNLIASKVDFWRVRRSSSGGSICAWLARGNQKEIRGILHIRPSRNPALLYPSACSGSAFVSRSAVLRAVCELQRRAWRETRNDIMLSTSLLSLTLVKKYHNTTEQGVTHYSPKQCRHFAQPRLYIPHAYPPPKPSTHTRLVSSSFVLVPLSSPPHPTLLLLPPTPRPLFTTPTLLGRTSLAHDATRRDGPSQIRDDLACRLDNL